VAAVTGDHDRDGVPPPTDEDAPWSTRATASRPAAQVREPANGAAEVPFLPVDEYARRHGGSVMPADVWILRDLVPRSDYTLLVGPPKVGKSYIALDIALAAASGQGLAGAYDNPSGAPVRVACALLEDRPAETVRRARALARRRGLALDEPPLSTHLALWNPAMPSPRFPSRATAFVEQVRGSAPDLLIVDGLRRVLDGDEQDSHVAAALAATIAEIQIHVRSVLLLHHAKKRERQGVRDRLPTIDDVRGSGDLAAAPRFVIFAATAPDLAPPGRHALVIGTAGNLPVHSESRVLHADRDTGDPEAALGFDDGGPLDEAEARVRAGRRAEKTADAAATKAAKAARHKRTALALAHGGEVTAEMLGSRAGIGTRAAAEVIRDAVVAGHLSRAHATAPASITVEGRQHLLALGDESGGAP
jgi:hypothetical protein